MPERDPRRLAAWAAAALVLLLLSAWYLARSRPAADAAPAPVASIAVAEQDGGGGRVVVDVAGAVNHPGVYRLSSGARVEDALKRAGGATRRADLSQINRAAKLEDGRQVLVPAQAARAAAGSSAASSQAAGSTGSQAATAQAAGGATAVAPAQPLNLNTATLEQLDQLDGVGPATAQKILAYREEHGGFGSVEELDQITGIGEKRLATLRELLRV